MTNYFAILGVKPSDEDKFIKDRYLALASVHHPDHGGNHERFTQINEAYHAIRTQKLRLEYVERLKLLGLLCSECMGTGYLLRRKGFTGAAKIDCPVCGGSGADCNG